MRSGPEPYDEKQERQRLARRRELAGRPVILTPEDRDPMNPASIVAANPWFDWPAWKASVPKCWDHGELRSYRYAVVLDDGPGTVIKTYDPRVVRTLMTVVAVLRPLMQAHRIEVPFWGEIGIHSGYLRGACWQRMEYDGQSVPNWIGLNPWAPASELILGAIHEVAHAIPSPESDLDPSVEVLGHREPYRRRFGLLLHEFLKTDTLLMPDVRHRMRFIARDDDYAPPIHPREGWRWDEEPVLGEARTGGMRYVRFDP